MFFSTKDLSVGYRGKPLIEHIDLGMWKGGILCLIGPNGSGKSTILRTITRQLAKLKGTVFIGERDLDGMGALELARHVSVVLTDRVEPDLLTCWEVAAAGRYPYTGHFGRLSGEDRAIVQASLEQVHALELREEPFSQLSDGQKQRVLLARALCQQPEVLVLDEPTSYLDLRHKIELLQILRRLAGEGLSVVLSLHEVDLAAKLADAVVLVKDAAIVKSGAPEDVLDAETIRTLYDIQTGSFDPLLGSVELAPPVGEPQVFVLPGGGTGTPCFRALQKAGVAFATGILQPGETDDAVASALAGRVFRAPPFAPPEEATVDAALDCALSCACILDGETPFGPFNQANLELLRRASRVGKTILTLRQSPPEGVSARSFSTVGELVGQAARLAREA